MNDIFDELAAIHREVGPGPDDTVRVLVTRTYPTTPDDLWDAITDPDRVRRWFLPLSGDLRVGGNFQLEGNAGGDILACEPPALLRVTFGHETSIVELHLSADDPETTRLALHHSVPVAMAGSVAGALFVGPGWDGALRSLGLHVHGLDPADPVAATGSPEMIEFNRHSIDRWTAAVEADGSATADQIAAGRGMATAQFVPESASGAS